MKVFVAGATGVIGRPLVRALVAAGHHVCGMTRSAERARWLRSAGAEAAVADALDRDHTLEAVATARPEVLVSQLTDLPSAYDVRDYERLTAGTNRLRVEGTATLMDAAAAAGAGRVVSQSIAFIYAPDGGEPRPEDAPVLSDGPPAAVRAAQAAVAGERLVLEREGVAGLVLRYGIFYGPGTWYARDGSVAEQVRRRRFPIIGRGSGVFSWLHVEDAVSATVAAVERGRPGVYNVCDDEPAPLHAWLPVYAEALGAPPPRHVPAFVARLLAGRFAVVAGTQLVGASNAKAKRELGWTPSYPSWREGFRTALG